MKSLLSTLAIASVLIWLSPAQAQLLINNAGTTGTTVNHLGKLTGAPSTAVITATTDVAGSVIMGIVVAGAGTTGQALIATGGQANCIFDASGVTAGHYVINSTATAGDCADGGAAAVGTSAQALGIALASVGSGSAAVAVFPPQAQTAQRQYVSWAPGQDLAAADIPFIRISANGAAGVSIACRVGTPKGSTGTVQLWMSADGAAPTSGTRLDTTACDANGTANTEQNMGPFLSALTANFWLSIHATGTWASSNNGSGSIGVTFIK